jgi:ABC-2 type transport system permease protein
MWTYVGAVALLVLYVVTRALLRDPATTPRRRWPTPSASSALNIVTKYWTASDRNTLMPPLTGLLLANRALWLRCRLLLALAYACSAWTARRCGGGGHGPRRPTRRSPRPRARPLPLPQPGRRHPRAQFWA